MQSISQNSHKSIKSIKRFLIPAFALLLLTAGLWISSCAPKASSSFVFNSQQNQSLDSFLINTQKTFPIPGLAVAVIKDKSVYWKTIGNSRLSPNSPFTDQTVFFTGAMSQLLVATAIMKLVESRQVTLDEPIIKHLPYFKLSGTSYQSITIRNLLTHTSGIPHHGATYDLPNTDDNALELTTRSITDQLAQFEIPGSQVKRTPYNYDILADLIQKVSGVSFEEYVKQNVFKPLGMMHSTFYLKDVPVEQLAKPHKITNWLTYSSGEETYYPYNREHAGSIGFHTTIKDLITWMSMILEHGKIADKNFLSKDLFEEWMKPTFKTGENYFIGLGWEIQKKNEQLIYVKNSNQDGFSADLVLIPDQHAAIVTISNISEDFNPEFISNQILDYLNGEKLNHPKIPIGMAMCRKYNATKNLDSTFQFYQDMKGKNSTQYAFSEEALSQFGVNFLYRLKDPVKAAIIFAFCLKEYPTSVSAQLDLAEAHLLNGNLKEGQHALMQAKLMQQDSTDMATRIAYLEDKLLIKSEAATGNNQTRSSSMIN